MKYIKLFNWLDLVFKFINEIIKILFNNDIERDMCVKQLFPINTTNLSHSSVKFDKEFLNKKLKEILPSKINKYNSISYTKNKDLIKY